MKLTRTNLNKARRGRPRSFDAERALDRAMMVFWRKGYEGTSLPDLTRAMGINRPSLYAAFGNKETLFRKALDRYAEGPAGYVCEALAAPTAREVVRRLLRGAIEMQANSRNPSGCLLVGGALSCGDSAEPIRKELVARRKSAEEALRKRFERSIKEGDLPRRTDAADLASYISTVMRGMAVEASSGATPAQLKRIADMALKAMPG